MHRNDECWTLIGQTGQYCLLIGQFRMTQGAARILMNALSFPIVFLSPATAYHAAIIAVFSAGLLLVRHGETGL